MSSCKSGDGDIHVMLIDGRDAKKLVISFEKVCEFADMPRNSDVIITKVNMEGRCIEILVAKPDNAEVEGLK
jgi:hypothetical protein